MTYRFFKSSFDRIVGFLMLILLSPLLIGIMLVLLIFGSGPVLFRQVRSGYQGRPFTIFKFATMLPDDGKRSPVNRITRIGRFLRFTSLDELPQLWNVAKGDMSLVGPRPLLLEYDDLMNAEHRRRAIMKPGITGWAQIHDDGHMPWVRKFDMDVEYVEKQSLFFDLMILVRTFGALFRPGRSSPQSFEPFRGYD